MDGGGELWPSIFFGQWKSPKFYFYDEIYDETGDDDLQHIAEGHMKTDYLTYSKCGARWLYFLYVVETGIMVKY